MKHYYAGSNSSLGFYSFYDEALKGLDKLFILKGGPGTGKSTLIRRVGEAFDEKGFGVEFLHCSSDADSLDGVILPEIKAGIVDGTAPHIVDPKYPGVVDKIINLGDYRDDVKLAADRESIVQLTDDVSLAFSKAYKAFADAKKAHDDLEEIYIEALDFDKANQVTEELMERFYGGVEETGKVAKVEHRFFGANTPSGPIHYYDNLTEDCTRRFIIKGRAGSGKSTMLKKLTARAKELGYDVGIYHCAFDPNSLDMIIVPELRVAIFDGTAPHVMEPAREGDEIVDMFERCIDPQVEVDKADEIAATEGPYKAFMQAGIAYLKEAKAKHDDLEAYYISAMDFAGVEARMNEIIEELT